jgi:hypothetical protein
MPLPLLAGEPAKVAALCFKGINKVRSRMRDASKDLMQKGPEEAKRCLLKFVAAAVKEEGKNKVVAVVSGFVITVSVLQNGRFPGSRFSLDPKQASIAGLPGPEPFMSEQPLACPSDGGFDVMRAVLHLHKGKR